MMRPDVTVLVCHTRPAAGAFISPSETRAQGSGCLADFVDPVEGVGAVAVLDADQLFAQAHGHRARLAVRDYELRGLALPLVDGDPFLDRLDAEFRRQPEQ